MYLVSVECHPDIFAYAIGDVRRSLDIQYVGTHLHGYNAFRSRKLKGKDLCFLAIGRMVAPAREAAELLAVEGVGAGVINARWLKPMDPRLRDWARTYPWLITVEDNIGSGGFGAGVLEALAPLGLAGKVRVMALPDQFLPHAKPLDILSKHGLDAKGLCEGARKLARVPAAAPPEPAK